MARIASVVGINGTFELGIYNGSIGTGSIVSFNTFNVVNTIIRYCHYRTIITGLTAINPVLRYVLESGSTTYSINTTTSGFCVNVVVKEVSGGGEATTLTALTDVAITTPANGQYLQYDTSLAIPKWVNKTPEYVSYNITGLPDIPNTFLNTPRDYFSLFATATYNEPFIVNYNLSNGLTLNSNGLITGLNSTKTYEIEYAFYSINSTTSVGLLNMGLYNDVVGNEGSSLLLSAQVHFSASAFKTYNFNPIITGQTQVNPVLKYDGTVWVFGTTSGNFSFNATLKIKEL
jgi:hypothetical protein